MHKARFALLLTLAAALLLPAGAATAAAPLRQSAKIDDTFVSPFLSAACGVPVVVHFEGTATATYFYDASGTQVLREIDTAPGLKFTVSSPAELPGGTGQSFTSPTPVVAHIEYPEGTAIGSPAIITFTGLTGFAAPGVAGAGRQVVQGVVSGTSEDGLPRVDEVALLSVVGSYNRDIDPLAERCAFLAGQ
jgi:hypothetical protein